MHANVVTFNAAEGTLTVSPMPSGPSEGGAVPPKIVERAVPRIVLANYANKMLHLFADVSYVALALGQHSSRSVDDVFEDFRQVLKDWS